MDDIRPTDPSDHPVDPDEDDPVDPNAGDSTESTDPEDDRTETDGPLDPEDDNALDLLIHLAMNSLPDPGTRPSVDALTAYLTREATPEQLAEVRQAVTESRSFSDELRDIQAALADMASADHDDRLGARTPPPVSGWEEFAAQTQARRRARLWGLERESETGTAGHQVPNIVKAVQAVLSWPLQPHQFAPILLRGVAADEMEAPPHDHAAQLMEATPEDAAIRGFMERVLWKDERFVILHPGRPAADRTTTHLVQDPTRGPGRKVRSEVSIYDYNRTMRTKVLAAAPAQVTGLRLWILLLPSLDLFSAPIEVPDPSTAGGWAQAPRGIRVFRLEGEVEQACFVLTYSTGPGYRFLAPSWEPAS